MDIARAENASRSITARCCIVGGGPAGMMLGYLLGRAGIETVVIEKHKDFFRDFRGDTVHPSTLEVMDELGLVDDFLKLPHQKLRQITGYVGKTPMRIADIGRSCAKHPFIAFMPQWDFLNFLREQARRYSALTVLMQTAATDLVVRDGIVTGVRAVDGTGALEIKADLVVGCDGRHSLVRARADLAVKEIGAPMDVLWFRVGKGAEADAAFARIEAGRMMITLDRGDYWQCAYVIRKGGYDAVKANGLPAFRQQVCGLAPVLTPRIDDVASWDDVKLLTVAINRLTRWARPGLLCIGDCAHAMSPVGGVGVNLAVQDAVAAANLLTDKLRDGRPSLSDLGAVQKRREFPTRITQAMQVLVQNNIISRALTPDGTPFAPPLPIRIINAVPWLQGLTARFLAVGIRPEHVYSRQAGALGDSQVHQRL